MSITTRAIGIITTEAINSNPNGDPNSGNPRQLPDGRGEISGVSIKAKLRQLTANKEGPVWKHLSKKLGLQAKDFGIFTTRDMSFVERANMTNDQIANCWDARVFGPNQLLAEGASEAIKAGTRSQRISKCGPIQIVNGISVSPIEVAEISTTNPPTAEGNEVGMAPSAYKIARHGVYSQFFFFNPGEANKTGMTEKDLEYFYALLPYVYSHTASYVRPCVTIRELSVFESKGLLMRNELDILAACVPQRTTATSEPSKSIEEYLFRKIDPASNLLKDIKVRNILEEA